MLLFVLLLLALTPAQQAEDLFAKVRRLNPTLADETAHVELALDASMGPVHDQRKLTGTYYYKREGRHKLDLPEAPSYLQKHSQAFGFNLPRLERYQVKSLRADGPAWRLELVPKTPQGSIERLEMWIHQKNYSVLEYDTYYKNGQVLLTLSYADSGAYRVTDTLKARIRFTDIHLEATLEAHYSDFRFNQGVSDALF